MNEITFEDAAAKAGWTPETQVQVLLEYIENQGSPEALSNFLLEKLNEGEEWIASNDEEDMGKIELDFDKFQSLWLEQECDGMDKPEDVYQLKEAIENTLDYDDLFETIRTWSNKPLKERVANFLKRNNAKLDEDGMLYLGISLNS